MERIHGATVTLANNMELHFSVSRFIATEADYLARGLWQEWLALFEPDGFYWMPADPSQTDPLTHVSHIYESAELRELRIQRFKNDTALSLQPKPRTACHVSNLLVEEKNGKIEARASLLASQYAYGVASQFHGHVTWRLNSHADTFRIELKRVDLLNSDGQLSDILSYL